jgi:hypothetical protein
LKKVQIRNGYCCLQNFQYREILTKGSLVLASLTAAPG